MRWISSMKSTSRVCRFESIAARSPGFSITGPAVGRMGTPSSCAITAASVVFPSPGGPYNRTWSSASPRCFAAAIETCSCSRTRSCPMYSSSDRGRSPASYWTSSSIGDALTSRSSLMRESSSFRGASPLGLPNTRTRGDPVPRSVRVARSRCSLATLAAEPAQSSDHSSQDIAKQILKRAVRRFLDRGVDGFLRDLSLVAKVGERREQVAAQIVAGGGGVRRSAAGGRAERQAILQLEADALRGFLADAGNARQARDVLRADRAHQLAGIDAGQDRERQLRADAADRDQALEQILLERGRESVERDDVLAHVGVDAQRHQRARLADAVERRERHEHVVADAADVDGQAVGCFFGEGAFEAGDHGR